MLASLAQSANQLFNGERSCTKLIQRSGQLRCRRPAPFSVKLSSSDTKDSSRPCMKAPSFHVRAKINNVFWCYISFTKNGASVPGARYVNPIENALTPSGRSARARKGKERRGLAWPRSRGPRAGSRYVSLHFCIVLCIFMH